MRRTCIFAILGILAAAPAVAQRVEAPGYFGQWEGTLSASDTNPLLGMNYPLQWAPQGVDTDPDYDWCILETMVSDPIHTRPFYTWPGGDQMMRDGFGTHEMGFSMGLVVIWDDPNGEDIRNWSTGELLMIGAIGMNHQEGGTEHAGMGFWIDYNTPRPLFKMRGVLESVFGGAWMNIAPSWVIDGEGYIHEHVLNFEWDQNGRLDRFRLTPINQHLGDMNLSGRIDDLDAAIFFEVWAGRDHDPQKFILADLDEDGDVDFADFLELVRRMG